MTFVWGTGDDLDMGPSLTQYEPTRKKSDAELQAERINEANREFWTPERCAAHANAVVRAQGYVREEPVEPPAIVVPEGMLIVFTGGEYSSFHVREAGRALRSFSPDEAKAEFRKQDKVRDYITWLAVNGYVEIVGFFESDNGEEDFGTFSWCEPINYAKEGK